MGGARSLCVTYDRIDDSSAIGRIGMWAVGVGLEAGYAVTVVTDSLEPRLQGSVEHIRLRAPGNLHLRRYAAASASFRAATAGRSFDVTHVFQPQLAATSDLWHVQFLVRAHLKKTPFPSSVRGRLARAQQRAVAEIEDRAIRRITHRTAVAFCSELLREQFAELYGHRGRESVLYNTSPTVKNDVGRRRREIPRGDKPVSIGFLGGADPRKGGLDLVAAALDDDDVRLVVGGVAGDIGGALLGDRFRSVGYVEDLDAFFEGIDVLAVPSRFEPFGLVVSEAVSRGVPCLVTAQVGAADLVVRTGAGLLWRSGASLSVASRRLLAGDVDDGCRRYMEATSGHALRAKLRELWES